MAAGRNDKLTPDKQEIIMLAIRNGNYATTAAAYAGIAESTFYLWKEKGKAAKSGKYREFYEALTNAEAQSEMFLLAKIMKDAKPKDLIQILKRRHRDRWGDKLALEQSGPNGGPIKTESAGTVQIVIGESEHVWSEELHGGVHEAKEEDLPENID